MAQQDEDKQKQSVPIPVVIAAGVALAGFVGWWGWKSFQPPPPPPLDAKQQSSRDRITALVKKVNGDWSKLSPEEQQEIMKLANGYGMQSFNEVKRDLGMK